MTSDSPSETSAQHRERHESTRDAQVERQLKDSVQAVDEAFATVRSIEQKLDALTREVRADAERQELSWERLYGRRRTPRD
jgi:outer membrane protein TolC